MVLVTVITPTYNRADMLPFLFESLQKQSSFNFEWLIVDDGSTDHTIELVELFSRSAQFNVRYIYKDNGGKHTALNVGIKTISTELTFIVDSDDIVLPDGIQTIEGYYRKYRNTTDLGVISFLRTSRSKGVLVKMSKDEFVGSYVADRIKKPVPGDMAEVFVTSALKEFPFPEFDGEKFLSEDVVWIPMGIKYKTLFVNKPIYMFEYLSDGLTKNDKHHKFASPLGSMLRGKMLMKKDCGWKANIRGAIIYNCYKLEARKKTAYRIPFDNFFDKALIVLLEPAGWVFYLLWKR